MEGTEVNGIRVGTRLEQLYQLRQRLNVEIEIEERKTGRRRKPPRPAKPNTVDQRLRELGVTTHDVKVWAVEHGVLPELKRGRIGLQLVETYAMHQDAAR